MLFHQVVALLTTFVVKDFTAPTFLSHQVLTFAHHVSAVFFTPTTNSATGLSSKASTNGSMIWSFTHLPMFLNGARMPFSRPSIMYPPISAITVEGEWMPNRFLIQDTNGSTMLVLIHPPGSLKKSVMPFVKPAHISLPACFTSAHTFSPNKAVQNGSMIWSKTHVPIFTNPSPIAERRFPAVSFQSCPAISVSHQFLISAPILPKNPPRNCTAERIAVPKKVNILSAIPPQSILATTSLMFAQRSFPICDQS